MRRKGFKHSAETKAKMSAARLGKKLGPMSAEGRRNISLGHKGIPMPDHVKEWHRQDWLINHPPTWKGGIWNHARHLFLNARYAARRKGAEGTHTQEDWNALKASKGHLCWSCKRPEREVPLTQDHIQPLTVGGSDYIENIQPLCHSCNSRKSTKTLCYAHF